MSDKKIILPELRFKGSEESDMTLRVELAQESRHIVEGDRTVILGQSEQYDKERQDSDKYRLTGSLRPIWKNYTNVSTVNVNPAVNIELHQELFYDNDYIDNIINNTSINTPDQLPLSSMVGKISSDELDFIRKDFKGSNDPNTYSWFNGGNGFGPVFSSRLNWNLYLTYPAEKTTETDITLNLQEGNGTINFDLADGLPFTAVDKGSFYELYCPFHHGLSETDFVNIGGNIYGVDGIGNAKYRSEENYFMIYKGQLDSSVTLTTGTFKRVVEKNNPDETTSEYYIIRHKVLRTHTDFELQRNGFESSIYEDERYIQKYSVNVDTGLGEYNSSGKVVTQENGDTYMFILKDEVDVSELEDHLDRPVTSLNVSVLFKNSMTFFDRQQYCYENQLGYGNEDMLVKEQSDLYDDQTTKVVRDFDVDDFIDGGIYEYNPYEMTERKVSDRMLRITYNPEFFNVINDGPNYTYQPHIEFKLRQYSDYIEESDTADIYNLPSYAKYFQKENVWKWRDIWSKGYINPDGLGVDYPFINGCHYINKVTNFYIKPDTIDGLTNNRVKDNRINPFLIDDCE